MCQWQNDLGFYIDRHSHWAANPPWQLGNPAGCMLFTAAGRPLLGHSEVLWGPAVALTLEGLPSRLEPAAEIWW